VANDLFLNGLDCVIGDAQLRGERLFCQASAQAHIPQRESTSEYPPLIYFRYVTPRLYRALPPVTRRTPAVRA
jgi:hypothetical protein